MHRHTKSPIGTFSNPDARFRHIHLDIVAPPVCQAYPYLLTIVDRFSRWSTAIPIKDTSAVTVCKRVLREWNSIIGTANVVTTDRGSKFQLSLFREFANLFGANHVRTAAYPP